MNFERALNERERFEQNAASDKCQCFSSVQFFETRNIIDGRDDNRKIFLDDLGDDLVAL